MIDIRRLAFIGGGNMAAALIGGLIKRGLAGERIVVADPERDQLQRLVRELRRQERGRQRGRGIGRRGRRPRGQAAADALRGARPERRTSLPSKPLVMSVAAGIPHAALARWFGAQIAVVRTMPNRPALNGFGATGLYAPASVGAAHRALAESIMAAVSATVWVEHESQMDTVTALSGSGPAYFFLFMEALEAAAHERGSAERRLRTSSHWKRRSGLRRWRANRANRSRSLRDQVTSKGGTTAAALAGARCGRPSCYRRTRGGGRGSTFGRTRRRVRYPVGRPGRTGIVRACSEFRFMEAIRYIVDTLLWLLTLAFVLRLLFQWVRADFRDPMADAIVRVTNWLILPLRRLLPPIAQDRHGHGRRGAADRLGAHGGASLRSSGADSAIRWCSCASR